MFGINGSEFLVLVFVALLVVGPERLPAYTEQLAAWVRGARRFLTTARERVASEIGESAGDVDWASLDPRRYDPRRIVRDALLEDLVPPARTGATGSRSGVAPWRNTAAAAVAGSTASAGAAPAPDRAGGPPFDDEAT